MASNLTGRTLGPFLLERLIGKGAMGAVYLGKHQKSGKFAAIKIVDPSEEDPDGTYAARFEREIKLLAQFRHNNIVRFLGDSTKDGIRYYAMEYVQGKSLEALLREKKKLPYTLVIAYGIQLCEALQEMHACGVVHRDLKPANILITEDHLLKLTDFGIAKDTSAVYGTQLTKADHAVGTVAYMSPEQLEGKELTRRSDLYALGMLLYQMLTGRLPFVGDTIFEYMNQRSVGAFPLPTAIATDIPLEFDKLTRALLAQSVDERPRDAYVVMHELMEISKKAKEGTLIKKKPKPRPEPTPPPKMTATRTALTNISAFVKTITNSMARVTYSKEDQEQTPFHESPWFYVLLLCAVLGFTTFMLWPLSDKQLYERGAHLMESEQYSDWVYARRWYFEPLMQRYPNSPFRAQTQNHLDSILTYTAEGQAKTALEKGWFGRTPSEAERNYVNALYLREKLGDRATAQEKFQAIVDVFQESEEGRPWVLLARKQLEDEVRFASDDERIEAKRRAVANALERADQARERENYTKATTTYESVVELYENDQEVADLVAEARRKLRGNFSAKVKSNVPSTMGDDEMPQPKPAKGVNNKDLVPAHETKPDASADRPQKGGVQDKGVEKN